MATIVESTGSASEPVIAEEAIAEYRRDGLLRIDARPILGEEAFARLRQNFLAAEAEDYRAHPGTDPYPAVVLYREIHKHYPGLAEVALSPRMGELAARLIGTDHVRLFGDETFTKRPGMPFTPWHQDAQTLPFDRPDFLTIWIAIDDVDPEMGPMRYVPGSHDKGMLLVTRTAALKAGQKDEPEDLATMLDEGHRPLADAVVSAPLRAGEAMIHHGALIHGAADNLSDRPRRAYALTLMAADTRYDGRPHWPTVELGLTPGEVMDHPAFPVIF